ncbi:SusC/RagA family TonB-linked outer membrane protein [Puia dinghuensis]|uniref:SusC/RagA family TonB-linked outer membrane protein n=1 Tax=Puia dinghuensis TaxID=1792502 RepID=A0A8J2XWV0_9BACT|nr:SusC/RagA family TonB-linked outer membrane protein [Puia dinghuensis]
MRIENAKGGVSADADGNFQIKAGQNATLVITGTGIELKKVPIGDQSTLVIQVDRAKTNLDEVVVTALGIRRSRNSLPYATQQVTAEELNRVPSTNFTNNLSGKVAGLTVTSESALGGSTNVILRGLKSLTQTNQALFVVDGVPFDNTNQSRNGYDLGNVISDVNPDNIESVSVLKGPAAAALYGNRGSNGVILITTKKGRRNRGLGITVNGGVQVASPDKSTLPTYQTTYGEGYGSAGNDPGNPNLPGFFYYQPTFNSNGQNVKIVQTDVDAGTGPAYDPSLMVYQWDAFSPGNANYGKATPWKPAAHHNATDFFATPVTTNASVYVDGGSDKGTFKIGYTNTTDKGLFPNSNLLRNNLDFSATHNVTDDLTVGGAINYSAENAVNRNLYQYTGTTNIMTDFRQWFPTNVDINDLKSDFFRTNSNATWNWLGGYSSNTLGHIAKPAYHNNPYWQLYRNYESDNRNRYFGYAYANYKFLGHFNLLGRVATDNYDQLIELRTDVGSVETPSYARTNVHFNETNYDLLLNYDQTFGDFNVKGLLGGNVRQTVNSSILAQTNGGLVVPSFWSVSNSLKAISAPTENYSELEVDGLFAGATLTYKQMLTIDGTLRRDKASTLPSGNNTYYYPSVSGNFVFSKLLPTLNWLSYGKLRANYAQVGASAPVYYTQNSYTAGTPYNGRTVFSTSLNNFNINLVPELNKSYEFGVEASFLNNRLGMDVTYYHSQLVNQIMPVNVSRSSGFQVFYENGGIVQNKGVEVVLNATPVQTRNFSWNIAVNWAKNNSLVVSLYGGQYAYTVQSYQNALQLVAETGKSYGILRGTDYVYVNGQREVDATGHYVIAANPHSDIGNINPDWIGGVTNTVKYKNFALSFLIDVRQGGQLYSLDMDYGSSSGLYPQNAGGLNDLGHLARAPLSQGGGIILQGVTKDGKPNTVRIDESDINAGLYSFSSSYGEADKSYVYDASYIKLREVALTYSLPAKIFSKAGIKGIDVALTGRNLWIIHKNEPYADPEQGQAGGNGSIGFQNGAYPSLRTLGCNLKVKF